MKVFLTIPNHLLDTATIGHCYYSRRTLPHSECLTRTEQLIVFWFQHRRILEWERSRDAIAQRVTRGKSIPRKIPANACALRSLDGASAGLLLTLSEPSTVWAHRFGRREVTTAAYSTRSLGLARIHTCLSGGLRFLKVVNLNLWEETLYVYSNPAERERDYLIQPAILIKLESEGGWGARPADFDRFGWGEAQTLARMTLASFA